MKNRNKMKLRMVHLDTVRLPTATTAGA